MPRNSRIPGIAQVSLPAAVMAGLAEKPKPAPVATPSTPATGETPKAKAARRPRGSAPKPVRLEPNFGKSGIRIFVGESKIPVATISQETLDEAFNDYGFAPSRLSELESLLAISARSLEDARADAASADVALQETLDDVKRAATITDEWKKAAGKNLDDLNAASAKVAKLNDQLDRMAIDLGLCEKAKEEQAAAHAVEMARAGKMGWLYFGSLFVLGILGFISLVVKGGR
jgi:hypothetical protein